jgi:hypothetical protein
MCRNSLKLFVGVSSNSNPGSTELQVRVSDPHTWVYGDGFRFWCQSKVKCVYCESRERTKYY